MGATALKLFRAEYGLRLWRHGIPADPARRTADQAATAALLAWAVLAEARSCVTLTPDALESE